MTAAVLDFREFPKQFVIAAEADPAPQIADAHSAVAAGWRVHASPSVPLIPILDDAGVRVGLLVGWSIIDGRLLTDGTTLSLGPGQTVGEDLLPDLAGRAVCLWKGPEGPRLQTDAGGFLPVVWSAERALVASTSTLIDHIAPCEINREAAMIFEFPQRRGFLPFGLTHHRGVRRLLPGHRLDLDRLQADRVWPTPEFCALPLADEGEGQTLVRQTAERVRRQVGALSGDGAGRLYLSGGHDSRMILAAARDQTEHLVCETLVNENPLDRHVATRVAQAAGATHLRVAVLPSTREEVAAWLRRTGWSLYDPVAELAATAKAIERQVPVMDGSGSEIMRATNWSVEDVGTESLTVDTLLRRSRLPATPVVVAEADAWLADLPPCDTTTALDIAKIELIHGCWAGPSVYGHDTAVPSISPFTSQRNNAAALRLPKEWKLGEQSYRLWMEHLWPQGLQIPVNRARGLHRLRFLKSEVRAWVPESVKRAVKPYR